jgi:hypothetical protein
VVDETVTPVEEKAITVTTLTTTVTWTLGHREVVAEEEEEDAAVPTRMVPEEIQTPITITCIAPTVGEVAVVGMREVFRRLRLKTLMPVMVCVTRYVDTAAVSMDDGEFSCTLVQRVRYRCECLKALLSATECLLTRAFCYLVINVTGYSDWFHAVSER